MNAEGFPTEEGTGVFVAVVAAPVTPADLVALAAQLPAGVILASIEQDHDGTLYSSWETVAVYGKEPVGHSVTPFDWEPPA